MIFFFLHHETNNILEMLVMRNIYWELTIVKYYVQWITSIIAANPQHPEIGTIFIVKGMGSEIKSFAKAVQLVNSRPEI